MSEEITTGSIVVVQSRTWPGTNKPGGVARVTAVYNLGSGSPKKYDVSYVLGGKEKGVEEEYVSLQSKDGEDDTKKKRGGLHISTSTTSLALTASPLATPRQNDIEKKEGSPIDDNEEQVIEERRKRKNSIQEDILMGSRNSSYNSLGGAANAASNNEEPLAKRKKIEDAETTHDEDESAASASSLHNHHKTAIWSARKHLEITETDEGGPPQKIQLQYL